MTHIKQFVIVLLIIFALVIPSIAASPTIFNEVSTTGGSGLNGKVFVNSTTTGMTTEMTADNRISISSITHKTGVEVKLKWTALNAVNGWSQSSAKVQHINDAGVVDSERIVQFGVPDTQGFVYFTTDFSTVIIGGASGILSISSQNQSAADIMNLGFTLNGSDVSAFNIAVTDDAIKSHPYDINRTGLVGEWLLDDNYTDTSGNGNNGTAYGGNILFVNGKYNNGTQFDGIADYVNLGFDSVLDVLDATSIEVWISPNASSHNMNIYSKGQWVVNGSRLLITPTGAIVYHTYVNGIAYATVTPGGTVIYNSLQHIILSRAGTSAKIYLNGELVSTVHGTHVQEVSNNSAQIGRMGGPSESYGGVIDVLRVYNRAFSASEAKSNYIDKLQQLQTNTNANATLSDYWNSTADNPLGVPFSPLELIQNLSFTVPDTVTQNNIIIYDYKNTTQFDVTATIHTGNDYYNISETAAVGTYTLQLNMTPAYAGTYWINWTTTNELLLNAHFQNASIFTSTEANATLPSSILPYFNISTGYMVAGVAKNFTITVDYFYSPTGLTSDPDIDHIHFDWDDYPDADYYNIYELEESAPYVNTSITLDAIKDSVYDDYAHAFIISTPNQVSPSNYETVYWFRNDTHLIGYADGFDADSLSNDDSFKLGVDNTGDGLTTDDRQFILTESGSVSAKRWSGSAWLPQSTSAEGFVVGSGGGGAIQYEMIIPLSEMAGFVDGVTAKFMMERKCTSLNPDVSTYFPETLINDTDGTLWATAELTIGDEYVYVGNSTTSYYDSESLTAFTWYKHNITAVNGVDESAGAFSTDITLDYPKYTVSGYIKDITGTPIANATVWSQNSIITEHDTSNATGYYSGEHFHNGTYRIFANATGYDTNNTTYFTIAGANVTNKNVTLSETGSDNLVNFTFTNLAYTSPIKEYEQSTITVDINDSDGTITNAIIRIHDNNYTMQYISGDQWRYIYSSGIITNHYITDIYATDNASGMNTTSYTTDYISILSRAGAGGGGVVFPPQDEEEDVLEIIIPTNVSDAVDFVENITKGIANILPGDSFSMLRINTNPFQPSYAKTLPISGVVDATSTDPNVDVGAVNNEVIVITRPPLDNSLYFKYDTSIDIVLDTGVIEHRDYSVMVIDLMAYIPVKEMVMQNANPYIFKPSGVSSVIGVRMWWIGLIVMIVLYTLRRYRNK